MLLSGVGGVKDPNRWRVTSKTVTFTGAAGAGAVGTVALFTVTGDVQLEAFSAKCTTSLVDAVDGAAFTLGCASQSQFLYQGPADLDTIDAGDWLFGSDADDAAVGGNLVANDFTPPIGLSEDLEMAIATQNITGGVMVFYAVWLPLSSGATLVAA